MLKFNSLFTLCLLLVGTSTLAAQNNPSRTVTIPAGGALDIVRDFIEADLLATDTATVEDTRYLLERGRTYAYTTQWQPIYSINLGATEGDGARPRILAVEPEAGEAPRFFRSVASFDVRSIWFEGFDTGGNHTDNAQIRPRGANTSYYVEDCYFPDQRQEIARIDADRVTLRLINNIIENNYTVNEWAKNGGIMVQQGRIDSVFIHDNTFFNSPGRITRNFTFHSEYIAFTNNTIVGVGGLAEPSALGNEPFYDGNLEFGPVQNLVVQNNVFYNVSFFGTTQQWLNEQGLFGMIPTDTTESIVISNNNIWTDPELLDGTPDTAFQMPLFTAPADTFFNAQAPEGMTGEEWILGMNISEELNFNNPILNVAIFDSLKNERWTNPTGYLAGTLNLPSIGEVDGVNELEDLDFGYNIDAQSYRTSTTNGPIGSSRWMDTSVGVNEYTTNDSRFTITSNFPNPVGSFTNIRMNLESSATLQVAVYDMNGRMLVFRGGLRLPAGNDQLLLLDNLDLPAGTYAYTVVAQMAGKRYGASDRMIVR